MQSLHNPWSIQSTSVSDIEAPGHKTLRDDDSSNTLTWIDDGSQSTIAAKRQTTRMSFWARLTGEGQATVGFWQSIKSIVTYSWLNLLFIFIPFAWVAHFMQFSDEVIFPLCVFAMMPLTKLLHHLGDQLALNCGKAAGDIITITVYNFVETVLAIILLAKCKLKLLQSTITGFILLKILFVSGSAFITGGLRRKSQALHTHRSQLNQTLLIAGGFTLLLPALFYNALDHNPYVIPGGIYVPNAVNESLRSQILVVSRALSPLLLVIYISSCYYIHYSPGNADAADAEKWADIVEDEDNSEDPKINFWTCLMAMPIVGGLMAITAEFLTQSIQPLKSRIGIQEHFFGLVLIPIVSYSADGLLATVFYLRSQLRHWLGAPYKPAGSLAETQSIELSIQFMLFWTPVLVLVAWIHGKPLSLLFDTFEVVLVIVAGFLLNRVTLNSETNWAEGVLLVVFYGMVVATAWFYPDRRDFQELLSCNTLPGNSSSTMLLQAPH